MLYFICSNLQHATWNAITHSGLVWNNQIAIKRVIINSKRNADGHNDRVSRHRQIRASRTETLDERNEVSKHATATH